MFTRTREVICILAVVLWPQAIPQRSLGGIEHALNLADTRDSGVEVRVWIGGGLARIERMYRLVKVGDSVSVERFSWAEVVHPARHNMTESDARRETDARRRSMQKERCAGKVMETADYFWCKISLVGTNWSSLFDDLLVDELWKLPPPAEDPPCLVLDGEAITVELLEPNRRHTVEYWNPDSCCRTVACAIVDHVRSVVRNIY
jgi:hypothetical protein